MTNTTGSLEAPLLKTDALGRMRTPAARREQLLDEFERSGASGAQFAKLTGLKYQTLATWVQQRKRRRVATSKGKTPKAPVAKVRWLEATVGKGADQQRQLDLEELNKSRDAVDTIAAISDRRLDRYRRLSVIACSVDRTAEPVKSAK